jgi:DNA mismatch repair ATPase MutL
MSHESSFLTIAVDKSHIITIGERLYEQSIELIRELVNNGYDADATQVDVTVTDTEITVADNGAGQGCQERRWHHGEPR